MKRYPKYKVRHDRYSWHLLKFKGVRDGEPVYDAIGYYSNLRQFMLGAIDHLTKDKTKSGQELSRSIENALAAHAKATAQLMVAVGPLGEMAGVGEAPLTDEEVTE